MRDHGKIYSRFWTNPDIDGLSTRAKLLCVYLLTNWHSNALGCYKLPLAYAACDLRVSHDELRHDLADHQFEKKGKAQLSGAESLRRAANSARQPLRLEKRAETWQATLKSISCEAQNDCQCTPGIHPLWASAYCEHPGLGDRSHPC
jgi:hypothetical protein